MRTIKLDEACKDFDAVVARVLAYSEATAVQTPSGEMVAIVPLSEGGAWQETAYLLSTPANAAHLRKSIGEAKPRVSRDSAE